MKPLRQGLGGKMDGVTPKPPGLRCPSQHTMSGLFPLPPPASESSSSLPIRHPISPYSESPSLPFMSFCYRLLFPAGKSYSESPSLPFTSSPPPLIRHPRESGDPWRPNNFLDSHFRGNDGFCVDLPLPIFVIPAPYIRHPRESGDP